MAGYAPSPGGSAPHHLFERSSVRGTASDDASWLGGTSGGGGGDLFGSDDRMLGGAGGAERSLTSGSSASAAASYSDHLLITNPFEGLGENGGGGAGSAGVAGGAGGGSWESQVMQLRERLHQVARAAVRIEEAAAHHSRVHAAELKRAQEQEREKGAEAERLRWELDQFGEREASRQKVSQLQDEVRNFKTASQHKLQNLEMQQLRERDQTMAKKLRDAEDELKR